MLKDWTVWHEEYSTHVFDSAYNDLVALCFDKEKQTLRVENVTLDMKGVEKLRKKLQEVERYVKKNQ